MKIVKHAKYVGTMIGPEGHLHPWTAPRERLAKHIVERLVDFENVALSVLGYIGSISAPDEAILKEEAHALQCTTAGTYNAFPADLQRAGSVCGLGSDLCGIRIISLAARFRTAACSGMLANGLAKIRAETMVPLFMLTAPNGRKGS